MLVIARMHDDLYCYYWDLWNYQEIIRKF